jgi:hypothetical protein
MRIYKRADFLKLPEGILFCKGKPWYWGTLHVKGKSLKNDFIDLDLCWIDDENNDDDPIMTGMLENGDSASMNTAYGRDGCFDDEDIFLVFEKPDLEELRGIIDNALQIEVPPA